MVKKFPVNHSNQNFTEEEFNFITIIPDKKFPKIWITSQGCPWALSIRTQISEIMVRKFAEKLSRKSGNC